ncbi:MAG: hypothetical protein ACI97K_000026 [Glaciecola sp.]
MQAILTKQVHVLTLFFALMFLVVNVAEASDDYNEIEWTELMPADDLQALLNPPEFLADIEDGSSNDRVEALGDLGESDEQTKRFEEALKSTRVIEAFDQQRIRIPGFIVPLESNEQQQVTQFFIVPYFGACLHLPPPPPNQIIYVEYSDGLEVTTLYDPYWFEGTLVIDHTQKELGDSAYTLRLDDAYIYEE